MTWLTDERARYWHPSMLGPLEVPDRFRDTTPAAIPHPVLLEAARDYARRFEQLAPAGTGLFFYGRAQTYKTYTACLVARWVHDVAGVRVRFLDTASYLNALELDRFNRDRQADLEALFRVPFLVLDDFANVPQGSWAARILTDIASERFNAMRPTCYTANLKPDAKVWHLLADRYTPSFSRRVYETTQGFQVALQ